MGSQVQVFVFKEAPSFGGGRKSSMDPWLCQCAQAPGLCRKLESNYKGA